MNKNYFYTLALALLMMPCTLLAQEPVTNESDDEIDENDEITVTDQKGNEEVIEFPEAMTYDLDSLMNLYMSKTYLSMASDCQMTDVNPVYTKEEYIERLRRMPTAMEMVYNEVVQKFIERYSGRLRHSISYMLGASNFYMPIFEEALDAYNLPLELKYLPVIESALNPKAVSRAGASGLWQFMITTGKQYGLNVNSLVDERRDPVKASYAAAHYLSDLWQIYPYLPKETRGYVPAFIAANYIMTYYCEHNICPMTTRLPAQTDTVMVNRDVHLQQIANVCNIDIDLLRALNPSYRRDRVPGDASPCAIRLPQSAISNFIDNERFIYDYHANELLNKRTEVEINDDVPTFTRHRGSYSRRSGRRGRGRGARASRSVTVRSGQTLSEIARRNHTTVAKLKRLNGIKGSNIRAGKKLRVK